jgi:hypothetical protein
MSQHTNPPCPALNAMSISSLTGLSFDSEARVPQEQHLTSSDTLLEKQLPTLRPTLEAGQTAFNSFTSLSPEISQLMGEMSQSAASFGVASEQMTQMLQHLRSAFVHIPAIAPFIDTVISAVTIFYDVMVAIFQRVFYLIPSLIVRIMQIFGVPQKVYTAFVQDVIRSWVPIQQSAGTERVQSQSNFARNLLSSGIGTILLQKKPSIDQLKYVNELSRFRTTVVDASASVTTLIGTLLQQLPDEVQLWFQYVMPTKWWLNVFKPGSEYSQWVDSVAELGTHDIKVRAAFDRQIQERIRNLKNIGQRLLQEVAARGPRCALVYNLLSVHMQKLDSLYQIVDISGLRHGHRMVPFVVYLYGRTGQGKSHIATTLPAILSGVAPDTPNLTYSRNASMKHWDGYTGQFAVNYDDYGAVRVPNPDNNEHLEMMTIVSNVTYYLSMADLRDKGEVFRSRCVIVTSNMDYVHPNEINDVEALHRRRHAFYEVEVIPEFRVAGQMQVDVARIPDDQSHLRFFKRHPTNQQAPRGNPLTYQQFIREVRETYENHTTQQTNAAAAHLALVAAAVQAAQPEEPEVQEAQPDEPQRAQVQGQLTDAFDQIMATGSEPTAVIRESARIRARLQALDEEEAEKAPPWIKAVLAALPIVGVLGALALLLHHMTKETSVKITAEVGEELRTLARYLASKRVQRMAETMDSEGRWDVLFNTMRNASPEVSKILAEEADKDARFAEMTDAEVSSAITRLLKSPRLKRFFDDNHVTTYLYKKNIDRKVLADDIQMLKQAIQEESERPTSEGRWSPLFDKLEKIAPQTKMFETYMDHQPMLSKLTDDQVRDIIKSTLQRQDVSGLLKSEGAYSGIPGKARPMYTRVVRAEGTMDENALQIIQNRLAGNMVTVRAGRTTCGVMLCGRLMLVPCHVFMDGEGIKMIEGSPFDVTWGDKTFHMSFDWNRFIKIGLDAAVYQCDAALPIAKDISNFFVTDADLDFSRYYDGLLLKQVAAIERPMLFPLESKIVGLTNDIRLTWIVDGFDGPPDDQWKPESTVNLKMLTAFEYRVQTSRGDCGSLLVAFDKHLMRKVMGIHIAGSATGRGFALPVTQEMLQKAKDLFSPNLAMPVIGKLIDEVRDSEMITVQGAFSVYGRRSKPIYANETTKIRPSILHGKIMRVKTAPSVMSRYDPRNLASVDPLQLGINKYGKESPRVNHSHLDRITAHLGLFFSGRDGVIPRRILTEHEALNGVDAAEFIDPINMDTSPGYPYNMLVGAKGKRTVIGGDLASRSLEVTSPLLRQALDYRWKEIMEGKRVPSMWIDTLKDERRSIDKVIAGKTRVFTIPPLCFTLVARRLFGAFNDVFYMSKLEYFSAVGINPDSAEWSILYNRLNSKGGLGFAGDYAGWDGNLSADFMMQVCELINNWYDDGDVNKRARRVIFEELIHTTQCARDLVYSTHHGNPSGNPFTTILNTILHAYYVRYVWLEVAPIEYRSLATCEKHVADVSYGDDGAYGVTEEALRFFNPTTFGATVRTLQLEFTGTDKNTVARIDKVGNLSFLKRGFRTDELGVIHPIIELQTIGELFNWVKESRANTLEEATVENANDALAYLYHYGSKSFNMRFQNVKELLPPHLAMKIHDFNYYEQRFRGANDQNCERVQSQSDVRSLINTKGIITLSQRTTEDASPAENPLVDNALGRATIGEPQWSLPDMVNRRVWIDTYQWTTANTYLQTLVHLECPKDVIVNYLQSAPFERFLYWRGSMRFHIRINGTRFHAGRLMAYFVPYTRRIMTQPWHEVNPAAAFCLDPAFIDPAVNPEVIIEVPYYNPKSFISINTTYEANMDFTGTFLLQVLVPLTATTGTPTTVNVTIWVEFGEDSEFHIPLHSAATSSTYNASHARYVNTERAQSQGNSFTTNTVINQYGDADVTTAPQSMTGDDFSGAASGNSIPMPFDRPGRMHNPINVQRKFAQNYTNSTGSEMVTRLDLNPSNMSECLKVHFSTQIDELRMKYLLTKPTWFANVPWTAAATIGSSLAGGFIGPMMTLFASGTQMVPVIHPNDRVQMTLWEYVSMHHAFWRGAMRLRFDVVCTQFHTGRLLLSLNYGAPPDVEMGLRDATSQRAIEFEINNEKHTFEFELPYMAATPWLQMCRGPISNDDIKPNPVGWWANYFTGSWNLRVVNPLVAPDAAPPNATIVMSVCGGDDFELYYPSNVNQTFQPAAIAQLEPPFERVQSQSGDGAQGGEDAAAVPPITNDSSDVIPVAVEGDKPRSMRDIHFGHKAPIQTVKDEMRRYFVLGGHGGPRNLIYAAPATPATALNDANIGITYLPLSGTQAQRFTAFNVIPIHPLKQGGSTFTTYNYDISYSTLPLAHYGAMYRFWRGGMRYKIFFADFIDQAGVRYPAIYNSVIYIPHPQYQVSTSPTATNRPNYASIALSYSVAAMSTLTQGFAVTDQSATFGVIFASDLSQNASIPYCEVEIPFTTRLNTLMTQQAISDTQDSPTMTSPGIMLIVSQFMAPAATATTIVSGATDINWPMTIFESVADDFRMGTLLGVPNMFCTGVAGAPLWPDTWAITAPAKFKVPAVPTKAQRKRVQTMDESIIVCRCAVAPNAHILAPGCLEVPEERVQSQGHFIAAKSRDNINVMTFTSSFKWQMDPNPENRCFQITVDEYKEVLRVINHLRAAQKFCVTNVLQGMMTSFGLRIYTHFQVETQLLFTGWHFSWNPAFAGLVPTPARETWTGYIIDANYLHLEILRDIQRGAYILRAIGQNRYDVASAVPTPQLVCVANPAFTEITNTEIERVQSQSSVTADDPSLFNIRKVIRELYEKHEASPHAFNFRAVVNELCQRIETAHVKFNENHSGSPHTPIFTCEAVFCVDCGVYNDIRKEITDQRKADAKEGAMKAVFLEMLSRANIDTDEVIKREFGGDPRSVLLNPWTRDDVEPKMDPVDETHFLMELGRSLSTDQAEKLYEILTVGTMDTYLDLLKGEESVIRSILFSLNHRISVELHYGADPELAYRRYRVKFHTTVERAKGAKDRDSHVDMCLPITGHLMDIDNIEGADLAIRGALMHLLADRYYTARTKALMITDEWATFNPLDVAKM